MPKISAVQRVERRDSLVDAARLVFIEKGFEAASISDIARMAGVSDGLLYRYFGSKRDLLLAVLTEFYERVIVDLEGQVATSDGFEARLSALVHRHVEVFVGDVDLCRLFIAEVRNFDEYVGSQAHELNRRYTAILMRILAEGVAEEKVSPAIDGRIVRDMLYGGIEHLAWRHIAAGHPLDVDHISTQISGLLLGGLQAMARA
ncbi:TetR/AcrR family transcriptional regulator [Sphingopyxis kveilinensis]|uniref:TetR/AcrR family transcriptional regulator n=1 Tax=Sphingopyxis kveilinensis TaxID=3114367 RepID=UPI0030D5E64C